MKVLDRYEGNEVELPSMVDPGRFRMLRPVRLNGCIELASGDLLWSDGSSRCLLTGHGLPAQPPRSFKAPPLQQDPARPDGVIDHALRDVALQMEAAQDGALPSPVMPAQLDEMAELHALERLLRETLDSGHLDHIARHPRMDMRYDTEVLPLSRARRLAGDALTRLASHSEDWHRRDITGVVPARLKAEVSEDELAIYENVVFVRLLGRLQKWLSRRVTDLRALQANHDTAKGLQQAERLDYRLRNMLCDLWGRSFESQQDAGHLVRKSLEELQALLGRVRQLLCSEVARSVPVTRRIPLALRDTNILRHDPHYRYLRPLWLQAHAADPRGEMSPLEHFERERERGRRHGRYVGLLLQHALAAIRLLKPGERNRWLFGPWSLSVEEDGDDWVLRLDQGIAGKQALVFVPAVRGHRYWAQGNSDRYVVFCMPEQTRAIEDDAGGDSVLNPMEFYGVERVRQAVETWLLSQLNGCWPFTVEPVPKALALAMVDAANGAVVAQGRGLRVLSPIPAQAARKLDGLLHDGHGASSDTSQALATALELARLIGTCRLCNSVLDNQEFEYSNHGFKARCRCGHNWSLLRPSAGNFEARYLLGECQRPFEESGSLELVLRHHPLGSVNSNLQVGADGPKLKIV